MGVWVCRWGNARGLDEWVDEWWGRWVGVWVHKVDEGRREGKRERGWVTTLQTTLHPPQNADNNNSAVDVHEAPDKHNADSTKHMFQQLKDICGRGLTQN